MNPLLFAVIATQGIWVRTRTEVLPPAAGPSNGAVGDSAAAPMRLAVLGESTAAGCGVDTHDNGFPGCLARELADRTGRPVTWEVVGQYGATARRIRHRLLPQLGDSFDLVVLLVGANDVLGRSTPQQWGVDLAAMVDELTDRAKHVVVVGNPPFGTFPSLPGLLRRYLAQRAGVLDQVSRQVCAERPQSTWINSTDIVPIEPKFFARDGFHPSAFGYLQWARAVAGDLEL